MKDRKEMMSLGARNPENKSLMRELYKKSGLTYRKFSALLGVKPDTLAGWVGNKDRIPSDNILKYAEYRCVDYFNGVIKFDKSGKIIKEPSANDLFARIKRSKAKAKEIIR